MTDLIALAKQAGLMPYTVAKNHKALQAFADLIRQDERDEILKLSKPIGLLGEFIPSAAIRARTTI